METQQDETPERQDHYLTADDAKRLAHYAHPIPMGKGFHLEFMAKNYPGWSWGQLASTLGRAGLYVKNEGHGARLAEGYVGALVLAAGDGVAIGDDGSLEHPLKTARLESLGARSDAQ